MKYLKYFETEALYASYKNGSDYVLPNVSFVVETKGVSYEPKKAFNLRAKYNATPDNLVAFTGASNITSLKVNGTPIEFEPIKNETTTFDVLGENISLDMETGAATFPDSYLIKSPVSSWSFKAKDPNYTINENTYVCMLGMMDGTTLAQPMPIMDVMGNAFTTNDGVTLELVDIFLADMNMQIQSGLQIGFTLMDVDLNSETFVFIDTEHQANVTTGGLSTYSFDSEGLYDVEIELSDPDMKGMQFAETSLISIEIGSGVTSIGDWAFYNCTSLTSITIPDSVTSIGHYAFDNCTGSLYVDCNIPSVTSKTSTMFYGNKFTSVEFGPNVTSIGDYAFYQCSDLTEVTIGSGVTSIGKSTFYGCLGLSSITCNAVAAPTIASNTFSGLLYHGTLTYPEDSDYSSWLSTSSYYLGYYKWNEPAIIVTGVYNVTSTSSSTKLLNTVNGILCMKVDGVNKTLSSLYTFDTVGEHTVEFIITNNKIGSDAFQDCTSLTEVTIGSGVTSIGNNAFRNCSGLTSIVIPDSVTTIGAWTFSGCSRLTGELVIPDSVTSIGNYAFRGCSGLTGELVIPDSVTTIGHYAFSGCSGLTGELVIPDSVTTIGNSAFSGCSGLTGELVIPDSVTSIGEWAFSGCSGLTSVVIPDSVTSIGDWAFRGCRGLTSLVIPDSVTSIGYGAFSYCSGLTEITIGSGVTSIGNSAFSYCSGLTSIVIPDSITSIGNNAFQDCTSLTEVTIGSGVTSIGSDAFRNCSGLTSIVIPDSVTTIGNSAFSGCSGLTGELVIPDSVTSIGEWAFSGCSGLTSITCYAPTAPDIGTYTFEKVKPNGTLKVKAGSDYSSWMSTGNYYLGYYNWTIQYIQ